MQIIGHGIDLVEISKIRSILDKYGSKFTERCFSKDEILYADNASGVTRASRYAARFAAKESVSKCLGTGIIKNMKLSDCEVVRENRAPIIRLKGEFLNISNKKGIFGWHVSLSHSKSHAIASVIAFSN